MRAYPRIRKTLKWGGAAVCSAIALLFTISGWWPLSCGLPGRTSIGVSWGRLNVSRGPEEFHEMLGSLTGGSGEGIDAKTTFHLSWAFETLQGFGGWSVMTPLWFPFCLVLIPTAVAWRLDTLARRRARLGFCPKCQYDRRGLAAWVVCPECGAASPLASRAAAG